jgi:D-amino peptidase
MRQILFSALLVMLTVTPAHPQETPKTVFISADMEGISGVVGPDQLAASGAEYDRSRRLMADDVNAAIRGARAGGATRVVVNDSHGSMRNLRIEDLEDGVQLISHSFKRYGMMEGLDDSFDAAIFIGYHTKAGSPEGIFAHTGSDIVRDVRVNGQSLGEGGLNTLVAGWYGVPVVLVTGDDAAVDEVGRIATGARKVTVKRAINPRAAELRPLADVHREIGSESREAVAAAARIEPRREKAYTVEVQFNNLLIPQVAEILPEMERPAPDTIRFTVTEMPRAYALIRLLYRYIDPD